MNAKRRNRVATAAMLWRGVLAAVSLSFGGTTAMAQVGGLQVTASNATGNSIYDLDQSSSGTLLNAVATLNTDGSKHGLFRSMVWVPNSATGTLDLIVADDLKQQIVRYSGPNYGTSTVIYTWSGLGKGPAQPDGLSVDSTGNLFVVSASCGFDSTPSVWVLPVNSQGGYGAPILIDHSFGGVRTLALAETVLAGTTTPLWNAGDLLVLVGDSFNARLIVYSQKAISGVLASPNKPLTGPTSTAIAGAKFLQQLAVPMGMDVWPADSTHGTSLLISTIDGRILRFDTTSEAFVSNFATGLGLGLAKLKTGSSAGVPYAFVAQSVLFGTGHILQFGAPPASGVNKPLATVTKGVDEPFALAVTTSSSESANSCVAPESCTFLGGGMTVQISGPGAKNIKGNVLEQSCTVPTDPRVSFQGSTWICNGAATLDVATYCPGFPHTIIPGSLCGHAGPTGAGFVVIKGTATGIDPNDNNAFVQVQSNINALLPGSKNLGCTPVDEFAWAPRPDLPGNEGTIPEDAVTPFFVELTGACDEPSSNLRGLSMTSFGLSLNTAQSAMPNGLPGYVTNKYTNLNSTVSSAAITPSISATLQSCISQSQTDFNNGVAGAANGFSCAAYQITQCDAYVRNNLSAFSSNLGTTGGNPNPGGDIDGRLANLFFNINSRVAGNAPNATWPATNVPPCITLTVTPATIPAGTAGTITWSALGLPAGAQCTLSSSNGTFNNTHEPASGSASTGNLTGSGPITYDFSCPGSGGTSGLAVATVTVSAAAVPPTFSSFTAYPTSVPNGGASALSWNVSGVPSGSSCTLSATDGTYATPAPVPASEPSLYTGALTKTPTYTATLKCPGTGGSSASRSVNVAVAPAAVAPSIQSFTANPSTVANGTASALSWVVTGVPSGSYCSLSATDGTYTTPNTAEPASASGVSTGPLTATPTYTATLGCPGTGGAGAMKTVSVTVAPATPPSFTSFTANRTNVTTGTGALLSWATTGVPSGSMCTLSASDGTYTTPTAVSPNQSGVYTGTLALTPTYTATLSCPGTGSASGSQALNIPVTPPTPPNGPQGMAFAPNGNLYVANTEAGQVLVYAPGITGSNGQLSQLPTLTITLPTAAPTTYNPNPTSEPVAVAFDPAGNLFVIDAINDQIDVYSFATNPAGTLIATQVLPTVSNQYYTYTLTPSGIAVDGQDYVYVASNTDAIGGYLTVYQYSNGAFTLVNNWNGDTNTGFWAELSAVALDGNSLLVGVSYDYDDSQVAVYSLANLKTAGIPSTALPLGMTFDVNSEEYDAVTAISLDSNQNIYVASEASSTVSSFTPIVYSNATYSGASPTNLTLGAVPGPNPALADPYGVALDGGNNIYVADVENNTVDVYYPASGSCPAACPGGYQYDFLPIASLVVTQPADYSTVTLTWSSIGVLPTNAQCSLTTTDAGYPGGSVAQSGTVTFTPQGVGTGTATFSCPGAINIQTWGESEE